MTIDSMPLIELLQKQGVAFPQQHWAKLHSTNPIERMNQEVKRGADVVGIFPNEEAISRAFSSSPTGN